jgi:hypothetical protein
MASIEELIVRITADNADLKNKLNDSGKSVDKFGGLVSKLGPMMAGAFSVGVITAFGKASFNAFESAERANKRLLFSVKGNQQAFSALALQASRLQSSTGVDEEAIQQIQVMGSNAGKTTSEIKKLVEASMGLAANTGMDLQSAYMQLNGTLTGSVGRLQKVDLAFGQLTEAQLRNGEAIDLAIEKYKGLAEQSALTSNKLSANWGEFQENVGSIISPAVNQVLGQANAQMIVLTNPDFSKWQAFKAQLIYLSGGNFFGDYAQQIVNANNKLLEARDAAEQWSEENVNGIDLVGQKWTGLSTIVSQSKTDFDLLYEAMNKTTDKPIVTAFEQLNTNIKTTEDNIRNVLATGGAVSPEMIAKLQTYKNQLENVNAALALQLAYSGGRASNVGRMSSIATPTGIATNENSGDLNTAEQHKKQLAANESFQAQMLQMNQDWANQQFEVEKTLQLNKLDLLAGSMASAASLFGEQTAAYRVLATGSALIATYAAASAALAPPPIGFGPAVGAFAVPGIIAGGLANVAKINGIGMEEGGIVPPGYPKDSYGPVFLTSGEQVTPPGKLPGTGGKVEVFGRLRAGDIYLANQRGAHLMSRRG